MKVLFLPVVPGQTGSTTVSMLVSLFMVMRYQKEVGYVPIAPDIDDILYFLDIEKKEGDISRSVSQVHKLMNMGQISEAEIRSYATPTINKFDLFNLNDGTVSETEIIEVQRKVISTMPYDYVFMDLDYDINHPSSEAGIDAADIVVLCVNQNANTINKLKDVRANPLLRRKHVMAIINQYSSVVAAQAAMLKNQTFPKRETLFIHYNPLIQQFMNKRATLDLMNYINNDNIMIKEISLDLCRVCDMLEMHSGNLLTGSKLRKRRTADDASGGWKI